MVATKPRITWKSVILPVAGILAFLIYLYVLDVDVLAVIKAAQRIDPAVYTLSMLFVFVETFFYALSWLCLLSALSVNLSLVKTCLFVWYGTFIDVIVPVASISGEVSKLYLVSREKPGTSGKVAATLVTQRLISLGTIITSLAIGVSVVSAEAQITELPFKLALFFAVSAVLALITFVLLCFKGSWMQKTIGAGATFASYISGGRWGLARIKEAALEATRLFRDSMKEFIRRPKALFTSTLFVVLSWLSHLSIAYLVFVALDFHVQWGVILITCSIAIVLPARGLPEIAMTTFFTLLGVPPEISVSATILTRILTFWLRFFLGFLAQQWLAAKAMRESASPMKGAKTYS